MPADLPCGADSFGLHWRSDIPLPRFDPATGTSGIGAPIDVYRVDRLGDRGEGRSINRGFVYRDGIRFAWGDEVAFDMIDGTRIAYAPGPRWTGAMPASFYSTVAALTAAWKGMVPLHACAVELGGRAILIAGAAGAGKSTMTAGLVALGAHFLADDLTILSVGEGGRIGVTRGRPTIRLHPDTVALLDTIDAEPVVGDSRGKWLARPRRRGAIDIVAPGAMVLLEGEGEGETTGPASPSALFAHLFRRRWIDMLPMRTALVADVLTIAAKVPILRYPAQNGFTRSIWQRRAADVHALVRERL